MPNDNEERKYLELLSKEDFVSLSEIFNRYLKITSKKNYNVKVIRLDSEFVRLIVDKELNGNFLLTNYSACNYSVPTGNQYDEVRTKLPTILFRTFLYKKFGHKYFEDSYSDEKYFTKEDQLKIQTDIFYMIDKI